MANGRSARPVSGALVLLAVVLVVLVLRRRGRGDDGADVNGSALDEAS